jgi:hypothetical protein
MVTHAVCGPAYRHDTLLVLSFVSETRVLAIEGEALAGADVTGFVATEPTLACGHVVGGHLVQVCH